MRSISTIALYLTLFALSIASYAANEPLAMEGFTDGKHKTCISCHQSDPVKEVFLTKHANRDNPNTPASQEECESCHGPSAAHSNFPLQVKNFRFGDNSPNSKTEQSAMCLNCHADEQRKEWHGGVHQKGELSCSNCHTIHRQTDPVLEDAMSGQACITCHKDKRTHQHITGLHPIEPGKASCTDCHNPHAKLDTALCVNCHTQDAATFAKQSAKAQSFHKTMQDNKLPCLNCHRGVAHGVPSWVDDIQQQQKQQR